LSLDVFSLQYDFDAFLYKTVTFDNDHWQWQKRNNNVISAAVHAVLHYVDRMATKDRVSAVCGDVG
jgi:phage host-nuclease inhibitor protein Gam